MACSAAGSPDYYRARNLRGAGHVSNGSQKVDDEPKKATYTVINAHGAPGFDNSPASASKASRRHRGLRGTTGKPGYEHPYRNAQGQIVPQRDVIPPSVTVSART